MGPAPNQNIENNPMQRSRPPLAKDTLHDAAKTFGHVGQIAGILLSSHDT